MSDPPKLSLTLRFPYKNPVYASSLPHTRYMPRPSHYIKYIYFNIQSELVSSFGLHNYNSCKAKNSGI